MASVDDLIDELFPEEEGRRKRGAAPAPAKAYSHFDDDEDEASRKPQTTTKAAVAHSGESKKPEVPEKNAVKSTSPVTSSASAPQKTPGTKEASPPPTTATTKAGPAGKKTSVVHDFDSDSDAEHGAKEEKEKVKPTKAVEGHKAPPAVAQKKNSLADAFDSDSDDAASPAVKEKTKGQEKGGSAAEKEGVGGGGGKKKKTPEPASNAVSAGTATQPSTSPQSESTSPCLHPQAPTRRPSLTSKRCSVAAGFDSDSDADDAHGDGCSDGRLGGDGSSTQLAGPSRVRKPSTEKADDDDMPRPSTAQRRLFTVPFPSSPGGSPSTGAALPTCLNRCTVTNTGLPKTAHPTIAELRDVASGKFDRVCSKPEMMQRKGAFYVATPSLGNGCVDLYHCDAGESGGGGCPHMLCRKCNYVVVRLQDAEWRDAEGKLDLYLTLRNYYPDWSRLASSLPVGVDSERREGAGENVGKGPEPVLRQQSGAAAYCCQCSWLTVRSPREVIETKVTDAAQYLTKEGGQHFLTELPRKPGEKRRPPLWICKGHAV